MTHLETDMEIYNYPTEKKGMSVGYQGDVTNLQKLQIAIKMIFFESFKVFVCIISSNTHNKYVET